MQRSSDYSRGILLTVTPEILCSFCRLRGNEHVGCGVLECIPTYYTFGLNGDLAWFFRPNYNVPMSHHAHRGFDRWAKSSEVLLTDGHIGDYQ
jgi:hypothetical protein